MNTDNEVYAQRDKGILVIVCWTERNEFCLKHGMVPVVIYRRGWETIHETVHPSELDYLNSYERII